MNTSASAALLYAATISTGAPSPVPTDAASKAHHKQDGSGFVNPWPSFKEQTTPQLLGAFLRYRLKGNRAPDVSNTHLPVHKPQFLPTRTTPKLRATWLGHACYYVEFQSGLRVLFDPVFEDRCSPFTFAGPKRYTPVPCEAEDIPFLDAIVISHNHYDHLCHATVTKLAALHPNCQFFVPIGIKKWMIDSGITNVTELDWWEQCDLTLSPTRRNSDVEKTDEPSKLEQAEDKIEARLGFVPSQHMTARTAFDKAATLWGGWTVESGGKKVYFAGDTGYRSVPAATPENPNSTHPDLPSCPAFRQIGEFRGPFDLGLIPIGAYYPRHIMSPVHADPDDAVEIFKDTKCKAALGMHWGTWLLTDEPVTEPAERLKTKIAEEALVDEDGADRFVALEHGESREWS